MYFPPFFVIPISVIFLVTSIIQINYKQRLQQLLSTNQSEKHKYLQDSQILINLFMSQQKNQKSKTKKSQHSVQSIDRFTTKNEVVPHLYLKFLNASKKVEIEHNASNLKMVNQGETQIKPFDDKLKGVKLKQIQNKNELIKVQALLFKQRKIAKVAQAQSRISVSPQFQSFTQCAINKENQQNKSEKGSQRHTKMPKSIGVRKKLRSPNMKPLKQKKQSFNSGSDLNQDELQSEFSNQRKGILFFNQLKRHPKILNYTLQRSNMKTVDKQKQAQNRLLKNKSFADQLRKQSLQSIQSRRLGKSLSVQLDPSHIIEDRMRKLYSKQIPKKIEGQDILDMRNFMEEQKRILNSKSKKKLSKQNFFKLKQKLNNIAYEINACRNRNFNTYKFKRSTLEN